METNWAGNRIHFAGANKSYRIGSNSADDPIDASGEMSAPLSSGQKEKSADVVVVVVVVSYLSDLIRS